MRQFFSISHRNLLLFVAFAAISITSNCIASDIDVTNIETRLIKKLKGSMDVLYVIKADVTNNSQDSKVFVPLQAIDSNGFELTDTMLSGTIHPGETKTLSDQAYMDLQDFRMIKEWRLDE
jgi:hypothetical protein